MVRWEDLQYVADLDYIYKYTSAESGMLLLENKTIHLNSPLKFNDPFDCHPLLIKISEQFIYDSINTRENRNVVSARGFRNSPSYLNFLKNCAEIQTKAITKDVLPKVKISCFSEEKNNLLMWSHYAKNHTGVCFEFDVKKMINYFGTLSETTQVSVGVFLKVQYDQVRSSYLFESSNDPWPLIMWLKTKSIDWEYEKEIRLVFLKEEESLLPIPSELLSRIYLGNQISKDYQSEVVRLCKKNFPTTDIFKMHLSAEEFKLFEKEHN